MQKKRNVIRCCAYLASVIGQLLQHVVDEGVGIEGADEHRPAASLHDGHGLVASVFGHGGALQVGEEVPVGDETPEAVTSISMAQSNMATSAASQMIYL